MMLKLESWTVVDEQPRTKGDSRALITHPCGLKIKWQSNLGGPSVYLRSNCCTSGVQALNGVMECRKCRGATIFHPRLPRWTHLDEPSETVSRWTQSFFPVFESIIIEAELQDIFAELEARRMAEIRKKYNL